MTLAWAIAISLVAPAHTLQPSCAFPGAKTHCLAPAGRASLEWREPTGSQRHQLWLHEGPAEKPVLIYEFDRHVDVLWSPDGRALAITDHAKSTDSIIWVVKLDAPGRRADGEYAFKTTFGAAPDIYRKGHRYFQAIAWRSPSLLEFVITAYDAAPDRECTGRFLYRLDGTVQLR